MQLVYFAPVAWESYAQRPHFMVRELVRQGVDMVLWVDPYPTRLPRLSDLAQGGAAGDRVGAPFELPIEVLRPRALPIEPLPGGALVNRCLFWTALLDRLAACRGGRRPLLFGCGRPSELSLSAFDVLRPDASFFDAMDDYPLFYSGLSRGSMQQRELRLARAVCHLFVSSHALYDKFQTLGYTPCLIGNAYEMKGLGTPPSVVGRGAVLGFVGTVGAWFDWEWVVAAAGALPDACIRLIGPQMVSAPRRLPSNIEVRGVVRREEVSALIGEFTAGLIPFRRNKLTDGVDPIKYYEYRAMGLPVISTYFGEMRWRTGASGVFICDRPEKLVDILPQVNASRSDFGELERFRAQHDWQVRFDGLLNTLLDT